jgi:20S proteasome alpha/beta subunit
VTIAVGFRCNDGIVLAADTQETISGYMKQHEGKITTCWMGDFSIAIAGAGTTDYIETAVAAITRPDELQFDSLLQIEHALRDKLLAFFNRHLLPWSSYAENDRPSVDLLIAVAGPQKTQYHGLFYYTGTSFSHVHRKAIGTGILLANSLISEYFEPLMPLDDATSVVVFILSKVKEQVDMCGGNTDIVIMKESGEVAFASSKEVLLLEKDYQEFEEESTRRLKKQIIEKHVQNLIWLNK